jgi:hypothetical protein
MKLFTQMCRKTDQGKALGRALAISEAFKRHGIESDMDSFHLEHPTNPIGVRGVMAALTKMAETLELGG